MKIKEKIWEMEVMRDLLERLGQLEQEYSNSVEYYTGEIREEEEAGNALSATDYRVVALDEYKTKRTTLEKLVEKVMKL